MAHKFRPPPVSKSNSLCTLHHFHVDLCFFDHKWKTSRACFVKFFWHYACLCNHILNEIVKKGVATTFASIHVFTWFLVWTRFHTCAVKNFHKTISWRLPHVSKKAKVYIKEVQSTQGNNFWNWGWPELLRHAVSRGGIILYDWWNIGCWPLLRNH